MDKYGEGHLLMQAIGWGRAGVRGVDGSDDVEIKFMTPSLDGRIMPT